MLLEYDMIEPSNLSWACGVVMAKKKGAAQVLLRLSLPERKDIKRCVPDNANRREPLETWLIATLDLGSAFWQVPLWEKDREKTGFA